MIDRLQDLELFTRIVEAGSLSAAARSLETTQPTVSKRLAALERGLGVRLLQRSTRRLTLTDEGQAWYENSKRWLTEVREVSAALHGKGRGLEGTLRVNAPVTLGRLVVTPLVRRFLELHPGLKVDLTLTDHRVDLVTDNVDVAVRIGAVGNPSVVARRLFSYRTRLVAAPAYLAAHGTPQTVAELCQHHQVIFYGRPLVEDVEGPDGRARLTSSGRFYTNDGFSFVDALEAGLGVGITSPWLAEPSIERGRLVRVLPEVWGQRSVAHAVYLPSRVLPGRVRTFVAFLQKELPRAVGRWPGVAA